MSGATVGLADTYIAALDNPAGLAMTLGGGDTNFATDTIYDGNVQNYENWIQTYHFGVALNQYPWGFSVGYVVPAVEGQIYQLQSPEKDVARLGIRAHEFHLSAGRIFLNNKLALGASLVLGQSETMIGSITTSTFNNSYYSYSVGAKLGVSYQLPKRFILGASYSMPMHYPVNTPDNFDRQLPGFFQPIDVPSKIALGIGWIPNRFLRADFTTFLVGTNENAALLGNDSTRVGLNPTLQPKIGVAYNFVDYKELRATAFIGTYYEVSRIQNAPSRLHGTVGIEVKPWILSLGWGLDTSTNYRNYFGSIGVDVFKVMEKLDIIPAMWRPPYAGIAPKPGHFSDEGLSRPLVRDWKPRGPKFDPIEIGLNIPQKIQEKAEKISKDVVDVFKESFSASPTPNSRRPKPTHHRIPIRKSNTNVKKLNKSRK
jgi:hypothetical protein